MREDADWLSLCPFRAHGILLVLVVSPWTLF
jgi:hypothetical protein